MRPERAAGDARAADVPDRVFLPRIALLAFAILAAAVSTGRAAGPSQPAQPSPFPASPQPAPLTPLPATPAPATPAPTGPRPATPPPGSPAPPTAEPSGSSPPVPTAPRPSGAANAVVPGTGALSGLLSGLAGFGAPQPYATFVRKTERQTGLIDIVHKDDDYYFDLRPDQFDKPYIFAPVLASGIGSEAFAGRVFDPIVVRFQRVGRRVLWVQDNTDFNAPHDSSEASALAISVTDSVINATPIVAEDEQKTHAVVSAGFFLTDFENLGKELGGGSTPSAPVLLLGGVPRAGFAVDATKSYLERTKALPANDEILASLAFSGPPGDLSGAPDARGVRLRMHYSILEAPPKSNYVPRLADDRVGYFITAHKRFDDDAAPTPFVRYVDRWNFARGPVVYYLTREIPVRYKPAIRTALLQWNAAFAKAGIPNAVEVRDQPADPAWDPDDARYSTVRWITSDRPGFAAYGPHIADPRTGEILRVEIVIDGESLRTVKRGYADQVTPLAHARVDERTGLPLADRRFGGPCGDSDACDSFVQDSAELAAAGATALSAAGAPPERTQAYAERWLLSVVLHESGHNFGLRHNFAASALYSLAQLHDRRFTDAHGLTASVMDYLPVNLSPEGAPQGSFFQVRLGPYDYWAIRYGYEKFPSVRTPDNEILPLRRIANESVRPEYKYQTDEDANGPLAIDPLVSTFDLSNDPLAYDRNQFTVYDGLLAKLDRIYPQADEPYYQERQTFVNLLRGYQRAALLATKYIGGIKTSRAHRGQPGGGPPFVPLARDSSERAFRLLARNVFSRDALRFSPQLLNNLGPNHYFHRGLETLEQPDFPIRDVVSTMQDNVLLALFSPDTMGRLADQPYKTPHGSRTMSLDDLFAWTQAAVWDDFDRPARDPIHRALQRRYTNLLVAYALAPSFLLSAIGYPSDTAPLARYGLRRLQAKAASALRRTDLDVATRAHLEDVDSRIRHALDPNAVRGV